MQVFKLVFQEHVLNSRLQHTVPQSSAPHTSLLQTNAMTLLTRGGQDRSKNKQEDRPEPPAKPSFLRSMFIVSLPGDNDPQIAPLWIIGPSCFHERQAPEHEKFVFVRESGCGVAVDRPPPNSPHGDSLDCFGAFPQGRPAPTLNITPISAANSRLRFRAAATFLAGSDPCLAKAEKGYQPFVLLDEGFKNLQTEKQDRGCSRFGQQRLDVQHTRHMDTCS